jgi:hypothetical protein
MNSFEGLLRSTQMTEASEDSEWMLNYAKFLIHLPDEYLVEALRATLMACAFRIAGGTIQGTSNELTRHGLDMVMESLKEGISER